MENRNLAKAEQDEKMIEKQELKDFNEKMSGKVENQNHDHNARMEGFARKEMQQNQ